MKMSKAYLIAVAMCLMLINPVMAEGVTTATTLTTLVNDTFDDGTCSSYWFRSMNNFSYAGTFSNNYSAACYRVEVHNTDPKVHAGIRSEMEAYAEPQFSERVYNVSILLPAANSGEEYALDGYNCDEILFQWHNNPDPGEEWTMPSMAFGTNTLVNGEGHYTLMNLWDDGALSTTQEMDAEGKISYLDLGSYESDRGQWVDWSFHIKWGWLPQHNTILEVYKNGKLVLERNGYPNTTNDTKGVNQQWGCYKWEWDCSDPDCISILTRRVAYFDNINVAEVHHVTSVVFPGYTSAATDPDNDGIYEDLNGNGMLDYDDVTVYYNRMQWITANAHIAMFDLNGNGIIDYDDVTRLYNEV